jgi:hypothetical protein
MLITVFDEKSSIGLVRLFFEAFVQRIQRLPSMDAARRSVSPKDFESELETSLDRFFKDLVGG